MWSIHCSWSPVSKGPRRFPSLSPALWRFLPKSPISPKSSVSKEPLLASSSIRQRLAIFRHFRHCMPVYEVSNLFYWFFCSTRKHTPMASCAILSNFFEEHWTQNHPQYLWGDCRVHSFRQLSRNSCMHLDEYWLCGSHCNGQVVLVFFNLFLRRMSLFFSIGVTDFPIIIQLDFFYESGGGSWIWLSLYTPWYFMVLLSVEFYAIALVLVYHIILMHVDCDGTLM